MKKNTKLRHTLQEKELEILKTKAKCVCFRSYFPTMENILHLFIKHLF